MVDKMRRILNKCWEWVKRTVSNSWKGMRRIASMLWWWVKNLKKMEWGLFAFLVIYYGLNQYFIYTSDGDCMEGVEEWERLACPEELLKVINILLGLILIIMIGLLASRPRWADISKLWKWIIVKLSKIWRFSLKNLLGIIVIIIIIGIAIVSAIIANHYFFYTSKDIDGVGCTSQFYLWKILWISSYPDEASCLNAQYFWERLSKPVEPLNVRNILLGFLGIVGLVLTIWRSWASERQTQTMEDNRNITEKRRVDERFAAAVKLLSNELNKSSYPAHLGAIISLRNLAIDEVSYTQGCLDVICSCNHWMEEYFHIYSTRYLYGQYVTGPFGGKRKIEQIKLSGDITNEYKRRSDVANSAISFILKSIGASLSDKHILRMLDFSNKMLCGIHLSEAEIAGVNFNGAYLNGASLYKSNMRGANLMGANLSGAQLFSANLKGARLSHAKLWRTNLNNANLQGVEFEYSSMIGAGLVGANLQNAKLTETNLRGVIMLGCKLDGVEINNINFNPLIFDEIQRDKSTQNFVAGVNKKDENKGISYLRRCSILKQGESIKLVIEDSTRENLKKYCHQLVADIAHESKLSKLGTTLSVDVLFHLYFRGMHDYEKIYDALMDALDELKDEALEEERTARKGGDDAKAKDK